MLVSAYAVGHPYGGEIIDAARRAALVEDPRLQRVLAAGTERGTPYVVLEPAPGRTLTELLQTARSPPRPARRLAGEASEALDRAATRGLHHLRLRPTSLIVARNGTVTVAGTAIDAAADGIEAPTSAAAARSDAAGLVALLYAALTGRLARHPGGRSRPSAPRVAGRPVSARRTWSPVSPTTSTPSARSCSGRTTTVRAAPASWPAAGARGPRAAPLTDPRGLHIGAPGRPVASMPAARAARSRSQSAPGTAAAPAAGTDPLTPAAAAADPTPGARLPRTGHRTSRPGTGRAAAGRPSAGRAGGDGGDGSRGHHRRVAAPPPVASLGPATASGGIPLAATAPPPGAPLADAPAPLGAPVPAAAPPTPTRRSPRPQPRHQRGTHRTAPEGGSAPEGGAQVSAGRARARDAPHISVTAASAAASAASAASAAPGTRARVRVTAGTTTTDRSRHAASPAMAPPPAAPPPAAPPIRQPAAEPARHRTNESRTSPRAPWTPSRSSDRSRTPRSRSRRSPPGPRWPGRPGSSPGSCCSCSPFSSSSSGCSP